MKIYNLALSSVFCLLAISGCSNTKLTESWSDPLDKTTYKDIMIVGISNSEMTRRAYESNFVASLQKEGLNAVPSYELISQQEELQFGDGSQGQFRKLVESAIKNTKIDSVLITHVVAINQDESTPIPVGVAIVTAPAAYYGNMYGYQSYVTSYVQPGYYGDDRQTYVLESSLFDAKTEELVWTARSSTFAPDSIQETIQSVTKIFIDNLRSRKLIK
jgi:hypothetical protein